MESILIRERYKIVQVLYSSDEYLLAEAVDIQDRERPLCLMNLYGGRLFHRYGRLFADLRREQCPDFQRAFLEKDTLAAVFSDQRGTPIDEVFFRGDRRQWQERLEWAELLLHAALLLEALPPEIGCAALRSENVLFSLQGKKVRLRFAIFPMEEMNRRELALMAGDQVRKILPGRLNAPDEELAFHRRMRRGEFMSVVALYSAWRETSVQIRSGYEEWEKKNWIQKALTMLKRAVRGR